MFGSVRRFSGAVLQALSRIAAALEVLLEHFQAGVTEGLEARVEDLERRRALWEAEMEGLVAKATQERKNARNAEERTRGMLGNGRSAEGDEDGADGLPAEYLAFLQGRDAPAGAGEGVSPVRADVAPAFATRKAVAQRFKFGG